MKHSMPWISVISVLTVLSVTAFIIAIYILLGVKPTAATTQSSTTSNSLLLMSQDKIHISLKKSQF